MATVHVPFSSTPHAVALARILHVTQQAWGLKPSKDQLQSPAPAPAGANMPSRPHPLSRRVRLARAAARAFEAQVMAIRCRQVFVG
ncbi:hypothetical protein CMPELA_19940 [Cupriavidus necator]|nr:hypothetical protein [Cupriavidus necator]QCC02934.1 hypothetical protein E6A55_20090 [Cupriavidus necator H16]QQB79989.1 hypothetical protein I6H87_19700 [Cupriavidus necator]WKA44243.1 hypothetical protein QWP09_20125 [Cupriavidus necator]